MSESTALTIACYAGIIALSGLAARMMRCRYREYVIRREVREELKKTADLRLVIDRQQIQRQKVHGSHLTANWPTKGPGTAA